MGELRLRTRHRSLELRRNSCDIVFSFGRRRVGETGGVAHDGAAAAGPSSRQGVEFDYVPAQSMRQRKQRQCEIAEVREAQGEGAKGTEGEFTYVTTASCRRCA